MCLATPGTMRILLTSNGRSELLAWTNNLLQLNITKVEQFGTGYAPPYPADRVKSRMKIRTILTSRCMQCSTMPDLR